MNKCVVLWMLDCGAERFLSLFPWEDGQEKWLQRHKLGSSDSLSTSDRHPAATCEDQPCNLSSDFAKSAAKRQPPHPKPRSLCASFAVTTVVAYVPDTSAR